MWRETERGVERIFVSKVRLVLASPRHSLERVISPDPVETEAVQLQAFLFRGEDDVTDEARFVWHLSWSGTYAIYKRRIAAGSSVIIPLPVGGESLSVTAVHKGRRHVESVSASIAGMNPTVDQVAKAIGKDEVLKALLWRESSWRQFDKDGVPLKNKGSSARGIGQVMEYHWADSREIAHGDYHGIAWQWLYCIEAARDILNHCRARVHDEAGVLVGVYGRAVSPRLTVPHLYLPGPHRGVFNGSQIRETRSVILTE